MEQLELFGAVRGSVQPRTVVPKGKPRWTRCQPTSQCDHCALNWHDDPTSPIPQRARWVYRDSEQRIWLCQLHAMDLRAKLSRLST